PVARRYYASAPRTGRPPCVSRRPPPTSGDPGPRSTADAPARRRGPPRPARTGAGPLEADRLMDRLLAQTAAARAVLADCASHPARARSRRPDAALRLVALRTLQAVARGGPNERGLAASAQTPWEAAAVKEEVRAMRWWAIDLSARIPPHRSPPG